MILQSVNDIARICFLKGIRNVVLSPGSRCAPITLAFSRHKGFKLVVVPDERSAAFIALGMAEQSKTPTVLVCTSGTAVLNYSPAVAEAFYRNIPLVILTADRPAEWIGQWDGQTISQPGVYHHHVLKSYNFPENSNHPDIGWHAHRVVNEAINLSKSGKGPVHINVPLREPFYPDQNEVFGFTKDIRITEELSLNRLPGAAEIAQLSEEFASFSRVLVVIGQLEPDTELMAALSVFSLKLNIPLVGDIISNSHGFAGTLRHADSFLASRGNEFQPDLLITIGQSVISKNVKLYLRKFPAGAHWHIAEPGLGPVPDPMQSLSKVIRGGTKEIFNNLSGRNLPPKDPAFLSKWVAAEEKVSGNFRHVFEGQSFNEFEAVFSVLKSVHGPCHLHLANSMAVRYANFVGLSSDQSQVTVHANRGTSGIDGSTSTAVGIAMQSDIPNMLITGDVAFFYDINAFWNSYLPANLKVLLLNNHGGGIFRLIPGPSQLPELEELFETKQPRTAARMAEEFGLSYFHASERNGFNNQLLQFIAETKPAIFEVETQKESNQSFFNHFKSFINT